MIRHRRYMWYNVIPAWDVYIGVEDIYILIKQSPMRNWYTVTIHDTFNGTYWEKAPESGLILSIESCFKYIRKWLKENGRDG